MRTYPAPTKRLFLIISVACLLGAQAFAQSKDVNLSRLEREMARLAQVAGGVVGATAIHLETGRKASINGAERFPMASTFKVPIAVELLRRVDSGELRLDQMIELKPTDIHPGSGTLSDLFNKPGVALSVRNLLELMMLISDNSATDVCLRLAGGAPAVTARMRALGITGINVDRSTLQLISDWIGIDKPADRDVDLATFGRLSSAVKAEERSAAGKRFDADPRDTSTPEAMTALLEMIFRKTPMRSESAVSSAGYYAALPHRRCSSERKASCRYNRGSQDRYDWRVNKRCGHHHTARRRGTRCHLSVCQDIHQRRRSA